MPARFRIAACTACTSAKTARASASSTRRWCTRAAPARRSCSARPRGGSRRSTPSRVIVSPAPGEPGKMPFWRGEGPAGLRAGQGGGRVPRAADAALGASPPPRRSRGSRAISAAHAFAATTWRAYVGLQRGRRARVSTDDAICRRVQGRAGDPRIACARRSARRCTCRGRSRSSGGSPTRARAVHASATDDGMSSGRRR